MNTEMFAVRVETMPELKLGSSVHRWDVGINRSTGVFVAEDEREHSWFEYSYYNALNLKPERLLHKFHLQQNLSYIEEWTRQVPEKFTRSSRKYFTDAGEVLLQNYREDSTTFVFDKGMKLIDSWQHQGYLIATLSGRRAAYAVGEGGEWHVEIRTQDGEVLQLRPDGSTWRDQWLSVCEDANSGKLVVTYTPYQENGSLDIFSRDGKTKQSFHTDSSYEYQCKGRIISNAR